MSGFNDPEKMRAAIELARSFGKVKDPKKKKYDVGGFAPRQEYWNQPPAGEQSRYGAPAASSRQTFAPYGSLAPPPSQREYGPSMSFSTGRAAKSSVIGNLGVDFLSRKPLTAESSVGKMTKTSPASIDDINQARKIALQTDNHTAGGAVNVDAISIPLQPSGNGQYGNILDTFYSILAKRPSLGQEIENITEILPKAMDLNAPGKGTLEFPPAKASNGSNDGQCTCKEFDGRGIHETTCPLYMAPVKSINKAEEFSHNGSATINNTNRPAGNSGTEATLNNGTVYSHSRKLSPVAPVFVPGSSAAQGGTAGANGVDKSSMKGPTKGLSASMWA